ncbi:ATP-binding protein [Paractinoplanes toevensis]|uniref:ATPase n=1 Tax=Paractinoplanes toevensis TaxID=571911 RepID=A0A919T9P9_9ACTN|nr:ATP-binding protein [Actinoplanes toevensis]GIM91575.1 ATPase [Actinoplanes toevensis]
MADPLVLTTANGHRAEPLGDRLATLVRALADLVAHNGVPDGFLRSFATTLTAPGTPPVDAARLDSVAARLGLTGTERAMVLLAGLPEEHEGMAATFRGLHPVGDPWPTAGLAAQLVYPRDRDRGPVRHELTEGAAVRSGLLRLSGDGPLFERSLLLAPAFWDAVHGADAWPAHVRRLAPDAAALPGLRGWLELPAVRGARRAVSTGADLRVLIIGDDERIGLSRAAALAEAVGRPPVAGAVDATDGAAAGLVALHAAVRGALPVLVLANGGDLAPIGVPGPVLVVTAGHGVRPVGPGPVLAVPIGPVLAEDRRRAWRAALPELRDQAAELAARHPLDPAIVAEVAADVRAAQRCGAVRSGPAGISSAIRVRAGAELPAGVRLTTPGRDRSGLVLPAAAADQLTAAIDRLRLQSTVIEDWGFRAGAGADRGVRLLFSGPPGTGKSLAAEVIAAEAETDLIVVDVSAVVSKWIGETEKNLAAVFDVAERTRAVLLLDEADALFGARTEVSDAHDRYANLETAYLLQRLDRFGGLVVLATNVRQNIDAAFIRRMDHVVEFGLPGIAERRELWRLHLPGTAPLDDDVDLAALAAIYPVPGAWIRNAAIGAAFLAAGEGTSITLRHLSRAMRREYTKAVRPYPGDPAATSEGVRR